MTLQDNGLDQIYLSTFQQNADLKVVRPRLCNVQDGRLVAKIGCCYVVPTLMYPGMVKQMFPKCANNYTC